MVVRAMTLEDVRRVAEIEQSCFSNPWAQNVLVAEIERSWPAFGLYRI